MKTVSKSEFKARALQVFRQVELTGEPVTITDRGKPVLRLVPYRVHAPLALSVLRNSVVKYRAPMKPVAINEWESGAR